MDLKLLRGTVRVRVKCGYPERAVNICAARHVDFWDLARTDTGAELSVTLSGYRELRAASEKSGAFSVTPVLKRGAPFAARKAAGRAVLVFGLLVCLILVGASSMFIWQMDVYGAETVSKAEILSALRELGVGVGSSVFSVRQERISNEMLLRFPELCWITLNTYGSRVDVLVREATPKPELRDLSVPTRVVATKTGIITGMLVTSGVAAAAPGDAVLAGEVLARGELPMPDGTVKPIRAEAEVWARTRWKKTVRMPLATAEKRYTGSERRRLAVIFGGKRINFYFSGGNPMGSCDKMSSRSQWHIGASPLPVTVVVERAREYVAVPAATPVEDAERILRTHLLETLQGDIGDGYALSTDFASYVEDGVVYVTLTAECVEKISRIVPVE